MTRLFAWIGIPYLLTLAAAVYFGAVAASILGCVCLVGLGVVLWFRRLREIKLLPVVLFASAVALGSFSLAESQLEPKVAALDGQTALVTGRLCELPVKQYNRFYYILEVEQIKTQEGDVITGIEKIRLSTQNALPIDLYDTLEGTVGLSRPSGGSGFSSRTYYQSKGISLFGFLYEYDGYGIEPAQSYPPYYYALRMREVMLDSIRTMLPPEEAELLAGVLLGQTDRLAESINDDFRTVGFSHVLSVSGLHMAIISQLMLGILTACRLPKRFAAGLTMGGVLCFMALTGFVPSVMRSGIMLLFYLGSQVMRRNADSINSLGLAVFLLGLANPYAAADTGLLLSFSATLGLLLFPPLARRFFYQRFGRHLFQISRKPKMGWLRPMAQKLWMALAATLGAILFTLPITVLSFGEVSLIAPLANLLLMLPSTLLIQVGLAASVLHITPVFSFLSMPLGIVTGMLAKFLSWMAHLLAQIPFASVPASFGFVGVWLSASLGLLGIGVLLFRKKIPFATVSALSAILLLSGILSHQIFQQSVTRVAVLDVGTGTCVVVSQNGRGVLLGCEGYSSAVAENYLKSQGISRLDVIQLTEHSDEEMNNAAEVMQAFPTDRVILKQEEYLSGALQKALAQQSSIHYYQEASEVSLWDGTKISLRGSYEEQGLKLSVNGLEILLVTDRCQVTKESWWDADAIVAEGLPQNGSLLQPFFMVLSMEDLGQAELAQKNWPDADRTYATEGQGHLILECRGREITIRREE